MPYIFNGIRTYRKIWDEWFVLHFKCFNAYRKAYTVYKLIPVICVFFHLCTLLPVRQREILSYVHQYEVNIL